MQPVRIAVLASGSGSNFQAILDENIPVELLITNNKRAYALNRAQQSHIKAVYLKKENYDLELKQLLAEHQIDLIVLAGYLKQIPSELIQLYPKRIINIHPSLLPQYGGKGYYGLKVHEAVIENNEEVTGATVHYVDENLDTGEILLQAQCEVDDFDTPQSLQNKVLSLEHKLLPQAIHLLIQEIRKEKL